MNKIFKVIYSKTRHCYVVVSELAKSHCKTAGSHTTRNKTALTAAVLLALGTFSFVGMPTAQAEDAINVTNDYIGINTTVYDEKGKKENSSLSKRDKSNSNYAGVWSENPGAITVGVYAGAGQQTVTIGNNKRTHSVGSVYIGEHKDYLKPENEPKPAYYVTSVGFNADAGGYGSIAIGSNAQATNSDTNKGLRVYQKSDENGNGYGYLENNPTLKGASVALGYSANAADGNVAIGAYSQALMDDTAKESLKKKSVYTDEEASSYVSVGGTVTTKDTSGNSTTSTIRRRISNVADGADVTDAATVGQLQALEKKTIAYNEGWGIKIGDYTKKDAAGNETTVKNAISVARNLGNNSTSVTQVSNTGLILGGDFSVTDRPDENYGNYGATGQYAVTLGGRINRASGESSVAAGGMDNTADGNRAFVGGGYQNTASGDRSSAIGGSQNTASGLLSSAIGGEQNTASGFFSSAIGGSENTASGFQSSAIGGWQNIARGWQSSAFGGSDNISLDMLSSTLGGMNSVVLGYYATGIAGGSTGSDAWNALAAGSNSVVTVENGTAIGYQATTDERGTIAFGHDAGDVSGYTVTWQQKATEKDGKYYDANNNEITKEQYEALRNADLTFNDYTKTPTVKETKYDSAAYNRLVKVADGVEDHDVVVMEQLKQYAEKNAGNIGNNITVYKTDEKGNIQLGEDKKPIVDETTTKAQNDSKDAWGKALGAKTEDMSTSTAASNSDQLITGKTLYNYDKPNADGTYVKLNQTTGQNLSALDSQVAKNTTKLDDENHNIKYYSVKDKTPDDKLLPSIPGYLNDKNDGAKGAGSMAAGFSTHADGVASTVAGSYSGVVGTGLQGAAALSYGTFNVNQNAAQAGTFSGVANSIVGQANVTTDSNAAIIYGAGNTVKNSYRDIDTKNASEIMAAAGSGDVTKLGEALQKAVPTSGGQVMVMGGGNNVESAYMTQVTGVGNKVTGSGTEYGTDSTQLNYLEGFYNTLENGKNDYIIGAHNTVTGDTTAQNQSNIVFGDNHKLTNTKNNLILGSSDTADDETTVSDVVSIGHNAKVTKEGGVAIGSGSEATTAAGVAGYDPTGATEDTTAAWTSKKAAVSVGTADETRQITGVAAGKEETDAVNVAQLKKLNGMKANVNADNIGKNLNHKADGTAVTEEDKTANENAWGTAIGTGEIAEGNGQLVTGKTVYAYNKPVAETGKTLNYVSADKTTGQNLTTLDEHVKTNADAIGTNTTNITKNAGDITNLKNLSNITDEGRTVIKNLSKNAVKVAAGDRVTVTPTEDKETGTITYKVSAKNDGKVAVGDQNLVSGDTVNTAINNAITNAGTATDTKLAGKANVDASNIGANLKGADGKAASAEAQKANAEKWGSAIGTGEIKADDSRMVTGDTVYNEVRPKKDGNYVQKDKTTGENLSALDSKIGKLDETKKYNYIDSGKDVSISDNLTKLDTQVKNNADAIQKNSESIQNITNNVKNLSDNAVQYDKDSNKSKVTLAGKDGTTITHVKDGALSASSTDAVNGKQLYNEQQAREAADNAITEKVTNNTNEITKIKNGEGFTDAGKTVIKNLSKDAVQIEAGTAITVAGNVDDKGNKTYTISANNNGTVKKGDGNLISGDTLYKEVHVDKDGSYIKSGNTVGQNLSALDTGLKTTSDLIHTNTKGDTIQIGGNSMATKIDISGKDANGNTTGRVITGVISDASNPNSAANVGYVNSVMNNTYGRLDRNINRAAAGSNALAALHPLDFDPADKASFAVGYGHYHNANAAAVGAFYQPNANTMVNMGISLGNGDPGFNAGVSFKIGKGSTYNGVSKAEMAQTIHDQAAEISTIKANDAAKDKRIDALEKENQEMKKQIQEILARLNG